MARAVFSGETSKMRWGPKENIPDRGEERVWKVADESLGPSRNARESGPTRTQVQVESGGSWAGPDLAVLGGLVAVGWSMDLVGKAPGSQRRVSTAFATRPAEWKGREA